MTGSVASPGGARRRRAVLAVLAVVLLGTCLRAPMTSVGPLLEIIGSDTGLGHGLLGLLGALPLLGLALVSPVVHGPAERIGHERLVAAALVVLAVGIVLRSMDVVGGLWIGTALIGGGIAVGNVLAPAIIKRDQPTRIALVTGAFTAIMAGFAAVGSGLSVPLSNLTGGGWRLPLGLWAVPVGLVAMWWVVRSSGKRGHGRARPRPVAAARLADGAGADATGRETVRARATGTSVWRRAGAWQVTMFMGLQAATFYILSTWMPSIFTAAGMAPVTAGWMLFIYHLVGIPAGLAVSRLMRHRSDLRSIAVGIGVLMVGGTAGVVLAPGLTALWVVLIGIGSGASLVVTFSLFGLRTRTPAQTAQLSGMAQSVGYLIAAVGPVLAGAISQWTGSWLPVLVLVAAASAVQATVGLWAARPGYVQ